MGAISAATAESGRAFAAVFRNPGLRRLNLAFAASVIGDWAYAIAVSVWAFQQGGRDGARAVRRARYVVMAVLGPVLSTLADRYPEEARDDRVRSGAAPSSSIAGRGRHRHRRATRCGLRPGPRHVGRCRSPSAPPRRRCCPVWRRDPRELTSANVVASTIESVGFFVGPALGGLLLAVADIEVVYLVNARTFLVSAVIIAGLGCRRRVATGRRGAEDDAGGRRARELPPASRVAGLRRRSPSPASSRVISRPDDRPDGRGRGVAGVRGQHRPRAARPRRVRRRAAQLGPRRRRHHRWVRRPRARPPRAHRRRLRDRRGAVGGAAAADRRCPDAGRHRGRLLRHRPGELARRRQRLHDHPARRPGRGHGPGVRCPGERVSRWGMAIGALSDAAAHRHRRSARRARRHRRDGRRARDRRAGPSCDGSTPPCWLPPAWHCCVASRCWPSSRRRSSSAWPSARRPSTVRRRRWCSSEGDPGDRFWIDRERRRPR